METLAVCSPNFRNSKQCIKYFERDISGQSISFAIFESNSIPTLLESEVTSVLIRVLAFSCNYRDKSAILSFNEECKNKNDESLYYYPFGSDFVAEVVQIGKNVLDLRVGDRVISDGSYPFKRDGSFGGLPTNCASQRFHKLPAVFLRKIPLSIPVAMAAGLTISAQTAYSMVRKIDPKKGQSILVTAATSNTSLAVIRLLAKYDVKIFAISHTTHFKNELKSIGVKKVFEPFELLNDKEYSQQFDAIIDPFYDIYLAKVINLIRNGGKYISCGLYQQNVNFEPIQKYAGTMFNIFHICMTNNISLIGNCLGTVEDLSNVINDTSNNSFELVIDSLYNIENVELFINKSFHNTPKFGKVIFTYE